MEGAKLVADREAWGKFTTMGITPSYDSLEAIDRASVVIDCTPAGNKCKEHLYLRNRQNAYGYIAQ